MSSERATDGGTATAPADADGDAPADSGAGPGGDAGRIVNTPDGYERVTPERERSEGVDAADTADTGDAGGADAEEGLGRAGWVLVAVVVVSFLVVPGAIYLRPTVPAEIGLRFLAAMLVLPFLPALLLGATAVWSLTAGRE